VAPQYLQKDRHVCLYKKNQRSTCGQKLMVRQQREDTNTHPSAESKDHRRMRLTECDWNASGNLLVWQAIINATAAACQPHSLGSGGQRCQGALQTTNALWGELELGIM